MPYIELQPGEELTVAFADGPRVYEGPQLVIRFESNRQQVLVYSDSETAAGEPVLRFIDVNG